MSKPSSTAHKMLFLNTLAFTICFAVWMFNGVTVTFLVDNGAYDWNSVQIGWLLGIPVLTGSIFRLPVGIMTDKFGGKWVFGGLLLISAIPMFLLQYVDSFLGFALCSFGYGLTGAGFAVGIAYTSVWYEKDWQGRALGIFGAGNAGAALTTLLAPTILQNLTNDGTEMENWRVLPVIYAAVLVLMAVIFLVFAKNRKPETQRTIKKLMLPLKSLRVWRFGLYYFLVFGCFVAFSQWLVPYYVNVYYLPLVTAGILAAAFSFPSGVIRALGGWMSDKWGARKVMYWVLGTSLVISFLLIFPKMDIYSPGNGIMAKQAGEVTEVSETRIVAAGIEYPVAARDAGHEETVEGDFVFPKKETWQEPVVQEGQMVEKRELLASGETRIFFQANVWVFTFLVIILGSIWGIGKAAVYKHIPEYFPDEVGVVGGMVGVLGGLGGFVCPIIFGYLLNGTGLWTSAWMFTLIISAICLWWMHRTIQKMMHREHPKLMRQIESKKEN
ncbi:NarK/NasA family nitrate transporter [Antarcticibacterium flavum]|uniref:NarK/NasA family nitrate transporter n=1 Tax=Antarcticibacterium flavum TaxID=2058175 RepID=A0A5B7X401_9FLAO|nr:MULTISPECIES: MFS transporter [Antarcticibacterium]MCM4158282.1 MFS transporter [Antarcticibacterium sp. W02-3]QCY70049.1 NarK/NasA family nitrate transporter [Antarcticibacterium flavum]